MSLFSFNEAEFVEQLTAQAEAQIAAAEAAARPAAQAMAQVFVEAVRSNVARVKRKSGRLAESIYQAYSRDQSTETMAVYHVSWNHKKAPNGHWIEYGFLQMYEMVYDERTERFYTRKDRPLSTPKHVPAQPFVRPAAAQIPQAQQAGLDRFNAELLKSGLFQ